MSEQSRRPNRLQGESSLYLQQHANNPVDWYPWGKEAMDKAQAEQKPIIVSIGYSSCHWCHVMEKESFEDPEVAAYQNAHFVSIKVDREERPDVDSVYMAACQILSHSGGWPLNAFLLPDGRPFFAGTYFPPEDRYGRPSWRSLLQRIHEMFRERREELVEDAGQLTDMIAANERKGRGASLPTREELEAATSSIRNKIDKENGGFGKAPKFPNAMTLELLALDYARTKDPESLELYRLSLDQMAAGGIYDHLGGGFHRYSVDAHWAVPHFEKMLYDNGLLLRLYAEGYRLTQEPRYREILHEMTAYIAREMTAPEGCFYASQDADSEGEEGRFFVWTPAQIEEILDDEQLAAIACRWYGVTEVGNFEDTGATVLSRHTPLMAIATHFDITLEMAQTSIEKARQELWEAREQRVKPARDDKRITAWSALVIQGLARAALLLNDPAMRELATQAGRFYHQSIEQNGGQLLRILAQHPDADAPAWRVPGFLDDHAFLAIAWIDLFQTTGDYTFLSGAQQLVDTIIDRFYDPASDSFQYSAEGSESLVVKTRSAVDEATPGAMAAAMLALQRISLATADASYAEKALGILAAYQKEMLRYPTGFSTLIQGIDAHYTSQKAFVAILPTAMTTTERHELRAQLARYAAPCDQIYLYHESEAASIPPAFVHLFAGKHCHQGGITYYICNDRSCTAPLTNMHEIPAIRF